MRIGGTSHVARMAGTRNTSVFT